MKAGGLLLRDVLVIRPLLKVWAVVMLCQLVILCCDGLSSGLVDLWIVAMAVGAALSPLGADPGRQSWEQYAVAVGGRKAWVSTRYILAWMSWGAAQALMVIMALINREMEEGQLALALYFGGFLLLYLALVLPGCIVWQGWLDAIAIVAPLLMMGGAIPLRNVGAWDIFELAAPGGFAAGLTWQPWAMLALGMGAMALSRPVAGLLYEGRDL